MPTMPHYGLISGTDNGVEGSWLIKLDERHVFRRCCQDQTRNGPIPISGAINHTRHQARASSSVRP